MMGISMENIEKWKEKGKIDKLIKAAEYKKKEIRIAAIQALGNLEQADSVNYLIGLLRNPDAELRLNGAEALGNTKDSRGLEFLRYASENDSDEKVKKVAKEAMTKIIKKY